MRRTNGQSQDERDETMKKVSGEEDSSQLSHNKLDAGGENVRGGESVKMRTNGIGVKTHKTLIRRKHRENTSSSTLLGLSNETQKC